MNIKDNLPTLFIVLIVAFSFLMVVNHAKADPVGDFNKVKTFVVNEWNETVAKLNVFLEALKYE